MIREEFARVAALSEIPEGRATVFNVGRYDVAIFNVAGVLHAYENACPHQGGPIGEGEIDGPFVTCPWHAWCFDLRTGFMRLGEYARLRRFDVRVDGDAVYVAAEPEAE
jgi:nitrite reductase (NADH) small subunit